jgi:hypothetical protein
MGQANPLRGAPRVHGELLKLGIQVAPSTVAKYMPPRRKPPSQNWRTFLANHIEQMGLDRLLYGTDRDVPGSVRLRRALARPTPRAAFPGNGTSHSRVDDAADPGSVSLERVARISAAPPRCTTSTLLF